MKGSMYSSEIAEPYAQALMSLAQNKHLGQEFADVLKSLLDALEENPELEQALASPVVKDENKKALLRRVLQGANSYLVNFMLLLVDKRRIVFLAPICQQYLTLWRKATNTVLAEVTSALKLTESQRETVAAKVKQLTGAEAVELETAIDPDIIGGVVIKVGSQVFDSSLRGQLRRIGLNLGGAL